MMYHYFYVGDFDLPLFISKKGRLNICNIVC